MHMCFAPWSSPIAISALILSGFYSIVIQFISLNFNSFILYLNFHLTKVVR